MAEWWRPVNIKFLASDKIIVQTSNYRSYQHLLWLQAAFLLTYFHMESYIKAPAINWSRAYKYMCWGTRLVGEGNEWLIDEQLTDSWGDLLTDSSNN